MQSVLFTVLRTDSVEKIIIWVATRETLPPDRLKAAYSATENSYNTANCVVCVLCLFLAVLWVYLESANMVFTSHTHFLIYCPVNKTKATDQNAWLRRLFCAIVFRVFRFYRGEIPYC